MIEQEARFLAVEPSVHRAVARVRALDGFTLVTRRRERQWNTYFDTPDLRLRRSGCVLKLRQAGRACEVTFKRALGYRRGVATRLELSAPLRAGALRGRHPEPMKRARALAGSQPLRAAFTLFTDRRQLRFRRGAECVEVDVDRVVYRAGRRVRACRLEVEVENLTASSAAFHGVIRALQRRFPKQLRRSSVSKYEYGFRAAGLAAGDRRRATGRVSLAYR